MEQLSKKQLKDQIVLQSRLHNHLKKWLNTAMILSTLSLSLALFLKNQPVIFWIALAVMTLSIIAMLVIGLGIKRGKDNLKKLFVLLDGKTEPVPQSDF